MMMMMMMIQGVFMTWPNGKSVTLVNRWRKVLPAGQDKILTESNEEKIKHLKQKKLIFKNPGFEDVKKETLVSGCEVIHMKKEINMSVSPILFFYNQLRSRRKKRTGKKKKIVSMLITQLQDEAFP